jgi:serine/threonine protein kinase
VTAPSCPPLDDLTRFRLGRLAEPQSHSLEQHLTGCASCQRKLASVPLADPLVQALRAQRNQPRLSNPLMEQVRQEVRSQQFRMPGPDQQTDPSLSENTVAGGPSLFEEGTRESLPFLSPPRAHGELGWLGSYRVLKVLGEGGMGMVLQGEDSRLQRRVALKVMKPVLAADPAARQRFLREARATAAIEHDHIVVIHQIDEANGIPYLAMPLLQGTTLEERLRRENVLPLPEVLRIGREVALGLTAAHAKGLIHRDIKPSNLWLEAPPARPLCEAEGKAGRHEYGRVKILDFGLASMPVSEGEKTLPGTILGTPGYMAPEQTEGQADHRADLFSLGCVLYRMATGRLPFKGETVAQKLRSLLFDTPAPPQQLNPALPGPLCHLIGRLLSRDPEDRPASASAVARVLETIQAQYPGSGARTPPPTPVAVAVPMSAGAAPMAVPLSAGSLTPVPMAAAMPASRKWLWLGIGGGAAVLLCALLLVWKLSRPGPAQVGPGPGEGDRSEEPRVARRNAKERVRPKSGTVEMPAEVGNRVFPETWVSKPDPIKGLKTWTIETNLVGQYRPSAFAFTDDERLLIQYSRPAVAGTPPYWARFDPEAGGLAAAPFDGNYSALNGEGQTCARIVLGGAELWQEGYTKPRLTCRFQGSGGNVAFSPDGKWLLAPAGASGGQTQELWIFDVQTGDARVKYNFAGSFWVSATNFAWAPDSKSIAVQALTWPGLALVHAPWKEPFQKLVRPSHVRILAWSPDAKRLATIEYDNRVHILDAENDDEPSVDLKDFSIGPAFTGLGWSPDGKELAFATADRKVVVWDLEAKKATYTFTGHTRPISAVAFLGDGRTLVSGSEGSVRFWDLEKGTLRGSLLNLGSGWLAISPEGNYRCTRNAEEGKGLFAFRVRTDLNDVQEFNPDEFRQGYGFLRKNNRKLVRLTPD